MNTFKSIVLYILSVAAAFMAGMLGHEIMYRKAEDKRQTCDRCYYKKDYQNYYRYSYNLTREETGDD